MPFEIEDRLKKFLVIDVVEFHRIHFGAVFSLESLRRFVPVPDNRKDILHTAPLTPRSDPPSIAALGHSTVQGNERRSKAAKMKIGELRIAC